MNKRGRLVFELERYEFASVPAAKSAASREPKETLTVIRNMMNDACRQPIGSCESFIGSFCARAPDIAASRMASSIAARFVKGAARPDIC